MKPGLVIKPITKGYAEFLDDSDTAALLERVADGIAERAEALAGTHAGEPVWMRRESDSSDREREAILAQHPTPAGREAGAQALVTALETHRDD